MSNVDLSSQEKHLILNLLKEKLGGDKARIEHYEFLNQYDESKMPDYIIQHLEHELELIESIIPKLDRQFKES